MGYALDWFNPKAILSVFEKVAWLQIKVHSNVRFELEATRIRLLSILIFICTYSRPISICLKSSLKSCQQNNIPKVFNPTKLFFSHFGHYVINVKAEKLERFYVEVMFPFGSRSPLSQFQTKLRLWFRRENFMSFHNIKKVMLKRNLEKKT